MVCYANHEFKYIAPPAGCAQASCRACVFNVTVTAQDDTGSGCTYTWSVTPVGASCTSSAESGVTTVPCGQSVVETFYCDSAQQCPRAELTMTCFDPNPPGQ